jgi:hypothetical protein
LKRSYKTWSKNLVPSNEQEDDNTEDLIDRVKTLNLEERNSEKVPATQEAKDRVYRQMKHLERSFNPILLCLVVVFKLNQQLIIKPGIIKTQKIEKNGGIQSRKSLAT